MVTKKNWNLSEDESQKEIDLVEKRKRQAFVSETNAQRSALV
tara:strand:+ start:2637 stop:2762 length:126 start_codon:yes stop_codon:yes gene_type:complete